MSGTSTAALNSGGRTPTGVANVESWDGTSWTEVADLATARFDLVDPSNSAAAARHDALIERLVKLQKNFEGNKLRYV